ncbi:hypothetical protein [Cutibacterium avidum]|uniref:hypothetical protein n=1 Tax=Cutibacterium avidum TaxID=33010 RepID=UPI002FF031DD
MTASTSLEAGRDAIARAPIVRDVVLRLLASRNEPVTHQEIIGDYRRLMILEPDTPNASDSGIRTRVSELVAVGLVEAADEEGRSSAGKRSIRWVITKAGRARL